MGGAAPHVAIHVAVQHATPEHPRVVLLVKSDAGLTEATLSLSQAAFLAAALHQYLPQHVPLAAVVGDAERGGGLREQVVELALSDRVRSEHLPLERAEKHVFEPGIPALDAQLPDALDAHDAPPRPVPVLPDSHVVHGVPSPVSPARAYARPHASLNPVQPPMETTMHEPPPPADPAQVGDIDSTEIRNARIIRVLAGLVLLAILAILAGLDALAIASRGGV